MCMLGGTTPRAAKLSSLIVILRARASVEVRVMPKSRINDPRHWRERAQEARIVADALTDPDSNSRMLRVAEDYEVLAQRAEQRLHHST